MLGRLCTKQGRQRKNTFFSPRKSQKGSVCTGGGTLLKAPFPFLHKGFHFRVHYGNDLDGTQTAAAALHPAKFPDFHELKIKSRRFCIHEHQTKTEIRPCVRATNSLALPTEEVHISLWSVHVARFWTFSPKTYSSRAKVLLFNCV